MTNVVFMSGDRISHILLSTSDRVTLCTKDCWPGRWDGLNGDQKEARNLPLCMTCMHEYRKMKR